MNRVSFTIAAIYLVIGVFYVGAVYCIVTIAQRGDNILAMLALVALLLFAHLIRKG